MAKYVAWMAAFFFLSPLTPGILHRVKARLLARRGPSLFQPYRDAWKLLHKGMVIPESATFLYTFGPIVAFASYWVLGYLHPPFSTSAASMTSGADVVLIAYLLGLARFMMALAVLDVGAPFGAMGSSRQFFFQALAEPTFFIALSTLIARNHTSNVHSFSTRQEGMHLEVGLLLALFALVIVFLAEGGRLPFDSPETHLELTMAEGGPALSYSGPLLLLLEWGNAMRLTFFLLFLAHVSAIILSPVPVDRWTRLWFWGVEGFIFLTLVVLLGVLEVHIGKLRLKRVVAPFALALILAITSVLLM
ncbi:MAG: hypothetical protein GXO55_06630 [Chloroflexi bacterium]|nr:hypothetical protein [Chloroflexota bacterium]